MFYAAPARKPVKRGSLGGYLAMAEFLIIQGDCRKILNGFPDEIIIITDPPYGISLETDYKGNQRSNLAECGSFPPIFGDSEPFDPSHLLRFKTVVLFGGNYYADKLPARGGWLVWDKRDGMNKNDQADCELAWTNRNKAARLFRHRWNGMIKASEQGQRRVHPTQKPVALFRWIISVLELPEDCLIVDPYLGSGACGVAAVEMGYNFVGIEHEAEYCHISQKRIRSTNLSFYQQRRLTTVCTGLAKAGQTEMVF